MCNDSKYRVVIRFRKSALRYANNRGDIHALHRAAARNEKKTFLWTTPHIVSAARAGAFMARALCNASTLRDADALQRREVNSYITAERTVGATMR